MMEPEQQYLQLEEDLRPYLKMLGQASDTIVEQEVSSYPVFVIHHDELELGISLVENKEEELPGWAIRATTLEELVARQVVQNDKISDFKSVYKPPNEYICLFVIQKSGATFVFLPRKL